MRFLQAFHYKITFLVACKFAKLKLLELPMLGTSTRLV